MRMRSRYGIRRPGWYHKVLRDGPFSIPLLIQIWWMEKRVEESQFEPDLVWHLSWCRTATCEFQQGTSFISLETVHTHTHTHTHTPDQRPGCFFQKLVARMDQPVVPIASGTKSNRHLPCYKANNVTVKIDSSTWWGPAPLYPCSPTSWGGSWEQLEEQLGRRSIRLLAEILPHVALSMFLQVFNGQSS